jgi:uncharacterized protein (DUF2252 family)
VGDTPTNTAPSFRREGEYWTIAYDGTTVRLRDTVGLRHLAHLLGRPGKDVAATDLVQAARNVPAAAIAAPGSAERSRVTATRAIRAALGRIQMYHPALAEHLQATIKTGTRCAYAPDPRRVVRWQL